MPTKVAEALVEITEALAVIKPPIRGFRGLEELSLSAMSDAELAEALKMRDRRTTFLAAAKNALEVLINDGYPVVPLEEVSMEVKEEIALRLKEMQLAFDQMEVKMADDFDISGSEPKLQPVS